MTPILLFPQHTLEPRSVDPSFKAEAEAASDAGFQVATVGQDMFFGAAVSTRNLLDGSEPVLYRGWITKPHDYQLLEEVVTGKGHALVTSSEEYLHCYHFPNWYQAIGGETRTPRSIWIKKEHLKGNLDDIAKLAAKEFGSGGVIVKDYIKSRKHEWYDACYISCAGNLGEVKRVVGNFIERQDEWLVGGLVLREYLPLKRIGLHSKSRLPLVNEHRFFVFKGVPFYQAPYWSEGDYSGAVPSMDLLDPILPLVRSPFYAVDIAELENGTWTIVEINDGCSAGIPEGGSPSEFYRCLALC